MTVNPYQPPRTTAPPSRYKVFHLCHAAWYVVTAVMFVFTMVAIPMETFGGDPEFWDDAWRLSSIACMVWMIGGLFVLEAIFRRAKNT